MAINKIVYGNKVLIDLTNDTVTADKLSSGEIAHDKSGNQIIGTAEMGGNTKNVQCYLGYKSSNSTSLKDVGVSLVVNKTGTYKISWMGWRSSNGGTNSSQLYINNTAYGSANTTFINTYGHYVTLNNVSLTKGQTISVWARARGASYYICVGNLCIEEV